MINAFKVAVLQACLGKEENIIHDPDGNILFKYKVEVDYVEDVKQRVVLLQVEVARIIYGFGMCEDYDTLALSVVSIEGNKVIHNSVIEDEEEMEARLFQLETLTDIYDLDVVMMQKMKNIRALYLK